MRFGLISVFLLVAAYAGFAEGPKAEFPTLPVDAAHLQLDRTDGKEAAFYEFTPTRGIVLDASGYKFQIPAQLKVDGPNSVHILLGNDRQYTADWKPRDGKQTLDASNLKPMNQSKPFPGFQSGDMVILGIGHSTIEGGTLKFGVIWVGMAKVK